MDIAEFARAIFALAITLGLIGLAAVGARRFGPEWLVRLQRPKANRRMSIIESLPLDPARRLVLVRLDSTERLLLLGEGRLLADVAMTPPPETTP
ncbi:MAG TPA: flagellar biosynthetic protein FliO [Caulobacteraceae bacterium]|jgi:flagellar protein FliO/FliZ|nr:flagellar biosynthetic protein FliO [Caulobacteraceae bacterium]